VVWIDHHKSAITKTEEYARQSGGILKVFPNVIMVLSHDGKASGALLAWWQFHPDEAVPRVVGNVSDWDTWTHSTPYGRMFRYGTEVMPGLKSPAGWLRYLDSDGPTIHAEKVGQVCMEYDRQLFAEAVRMAGRVCKWELPPPFGTLSVRVANVVLANSDRLGGDKALGLYDMLVGYCQMSTGAWRVSLYSSRADVDCGQIAGLFGGGGRKGAAGFYCEVLPPWKWTDTVHD
jgi:hypothetical protein